MPLKKSQFIDKVPWWIASVIALAYIIAFVICCAVGGAGPSSAYNIQAVTQGPASNLTCVDPTACDVTWTGSISGLSGLNQALWMTAEMQRPLDASANNSRYALLNTGARMELYQWCLHVYILLTSSRKRQFGVCLELGKTGKFQHLLTVIRRLHDSYNMADSCVR